jgi:hypothetical protein
MRDCLLKSLNHAADLSSRLSAGLLLKESNEGLEGVGLLTSTGSGCGRSSRLGGLNRDRCDGGGLGLDWGGRGRLSSRGFGSLGGRLGGDTGRLRGDGSWLRRNSSGLGSRSGRLGALGRPRLVGLGLDALEVVWVPLLALKALGALVGTLEVLATTLVVLLDGTGGIGSLGGADSGKHGGRSNNDAGDSAGKHGGSAVRYGVGSNDTGYLRSRSRGNLRLNGCGGRSGDRGSRSRALNGGRYLNRGN